VVSEAKLWSWDKAKVVLFNLRGATWEQYYLGDCCWSLFKLRPVNAFHRSISQTRRI
jgi:hypothetical protein